MEIDQNLRSAIGFAGYGDPNSPLWIVSYDPIVEWDINKLEAYKDITFSFDYDLKNLGEYNSRYFGFSEIIDNAFPAIGYQHRYFFTSILPFGSGSEAQTIIESSLFGNSAALREGWFFTNIKTERFIALETFYRSYDWREKTILFCGCSDNKGILQDVKQFLKELYQIDKLPFEPDQYVNSIWSDYTKKRFVIPKLHNSEAKDPDLKKLVMARLKIETAR